MRRIKTKLNARLVIRQKDDLFGANISVNEISFPQRQTSTGTQAVARVAGVERGRGKGIGRKGKRGGGLVRGGGRRSLPFSLPPSPLPLPILRLPRRLLRQRLSNSLFIGNVRWIGE